MCKGTVIAFVAVIAVVGCSQPKQTIALPSIVPLEAGDKPIFAVAWSPDGSLVGVGTDLGEVMVFDANTGERLSTLPRTLGRVTDLVFNESGQRLLGVSLDGRWCEWYVGKPTASTECYLEIPPLLGVKTSAHGRSVVAPSGAWAARELSEGLLVVTETEVSLEGRPIWSPPNEGRITAARISENFVAVGTRKGELFLLDHSGKVVASARDGWHRINTISFSPRGELVADGGVDGILRISALPDLRLVATLPFETGWITDCDFSPDGTRILVAGHDLTHRPGINRVRIWVVPRPNTKPSG